MLFVVIDSRAVNVGGALRKVGRKESDWAEQISGALVEMWVEFIDSWDIPRSTS